MSTTAPTAPRSLSTDESSRTPLPNWMREPLLHFVLIGVLLFALDHVVSSQADDPRSIVVGAAVDAEAVQLFEQARGRAPNEEELRALHQVWLDNEVLYREGLEMQVDRGDDAIRERVIFKALSVLDANVKVPPIEDAELRKWFEANRAKYDDPARFSFEEAALAGEASEAAVRAFVSALNAGKPGDSEAGLRVFKDRPHASIVQSYGADFTKALEESTVGEWRALKTRDEWRAMKLDSTTKAKPAVYESLRGVVLQDWKDATASEQRTAAVRVLARKYKVTYEAAPK